MMIEHVRQEDPSGCVIACIAMVAGKTYQEIKDKDFPDWNEKGINSDVRDMAFVKNGIWPKRHIDLNLYPGCLYTVTVASLNRKGGMHQVLIDCRGDASELYDPQKGNDDKEHYTTETLISFGDVVELVDVNFMEA